MAGMAHGRNCGIFSFQVRMAIPVCLRVITVPSLQYSVLSSKYRDLVEMWTSK